LLSLFDMLCFGCFWKDAERPSDQPNLPRTTITLTLPLKEVTASALNESGAAAGADVVVDSAQLLGALGVHQQRESTVSLPVRATSPSPRTEEQSGLAIEEARQEALPQVDQLAQQIEDFPAATETIHAEVEPVAVQLAKDVQDLAFIGQGAHGHVYRGECRVFTETHSLEAGTFLPYSCPIGNVAVAFAWHRTLLCVCHANRAPSPAAEQQKTCCMRRQGHMQA
jgi:hypothetical protein